MTPKILKSNNIKSIYTLIKSKSDENANKRYKNNERLKSDYKEICENIVKNDEIRVEIDVIQREKTEMIAEVIGDFDIVKGVRIYGQGFDPQGEFGCVI